MVETLSVSVSGLAFSLLLYENVKSNYDQEGFLLGEIITREKSKVTDADQEVVNIEKIIHINSVIACPQQCYFYNQAGKIDRQRLKEFLGDKISNVVAWYKYKKITSFKMTLREKIIHKQLANLFNTDLFSMCILLTDASENFSTHSFYQTFIRYSGDYQSIPLYIINLSQKNDYYKVSEPVPKGFEKIIKTANVDLENSQGLIVAKKIQVALQTHINQLVSSLDESEKELFELEEDVKQLKQNLKWKHELNCNIDNGLNSNIINGMIDNISVDVPATDTCPTSSSEKKMRNRGVKNIKKDLQTPTKSEGNWTINDTLTRTRSRTQKLQN